MTGTELLERFNKTPTQHKVIGIVLLSIVLGAAFYYLVYADLTERSDRLDRQIVNLRQEKAAYEEKQRQYNAFRAEVNKLLEEQKELVKVLPTDAEISSFLQSIHAQGELSGLNILVFEQKPEIRQNFYAEIPVQMAISGTFHQIEKFFHAVGSLKRIVNIQNVTLKEPVLSDQKMVLKALFSTSTFRFLAAPPPAAAPPGGGAPPAPHG